MPFTKLQTELDSRAAQGLLRRRRTLESAQGVRITIDGKPYLSFCSNDYLGLANHPKIVEALQQGAQQFGVGSGASHLVSGHFDAHHQFEQAFAAFVGKPAALLFSSGYMANLGVVQALVGRGDTVFADKLNHASLNDAMLLSRAEVRRYRHNDMAHLEKLLSESVGDDAELPHPNPPPMGEGTNEKRRELNPGRKLIITDAVFSMDGDIAPVPELLALCEKYDAWLLLDDAHGFGVLGEQGRGTLSYCKFHPAHLLPARSTPLGATLLRSDPASGKSGENSLSECNLKSASEPLSPLWQRGAGGDLYPERIIYMATLGKAAGVSGACVAAEQVVIDTLLQNARSYIYTTASPPVLSVALLASLQLMRDENWRRERLQQLIAQLRNGAKNLPWRMMDSSTPIQPLLVGSNEAALALSEGLRARGIWVPAIRPPTVPHGTARLRITLSAAHTERDVAELLEALYELALES